jgi:predicted O-linked N-acetylglucosamine transferase (SPINDLY family)
MSKTPPQRDPRNPSAEILDALRRAMRAHNAGNLGEAETLYNLVLAYDKRQFDALNMLGIVHGQRRNYDEAIRLIERAIKVNPRSAEAYANLGRVQFAMGEPQRAAASYAKSLTIKPDFTMAHSNFAAVLRGLKRPQESLAHCDKALAARPDYAEALNNRGNALFDLRRHEESLASYDRALALAPGMVEACLGRGNACVELSRYDEAAAAYDRALALNPSAADAFIGQGNILSKLKREDEALAAYNKALAIDPRSTHALQACGSVAQDKRRYGDAFAAYDRAWAIDPTLKYIEGYRLHAKMHLCDWTNLESECAHLVANVRNGLRATGPFALVGITSSTADQLKCARTLIADRLPPSSKPMPLTAPYGHDRITVAYLSADFRDHAVSYLLAGLIEKHDRSRFRTIAFSFAPVTASQMRARLTDAFELFIDVGDMENKQIADLLRAHEVDIVVDLMGFTGDFRTGIMALRPASIQVSYLGYAGTMGADFIDYMIADRIVIPPDQQQFYAEKIVYLPDSYQANDDKRMIGPDMSRAAAGLPDNGLVFCCFNQNFKILPDVFDIWMRLLREIDGSVVWIQEGEPIAARNLRAEAERRGIAADRIVFAPKVPTYEDYLARFRLADLFLDTLPYNAHTTASDALWAGVPVVTCFGSTFASRVAASLLHAIGLPELVTTSLADYEALALRLARQPELLGAVKTKLAAHRSTHALFDTDRFRRNIEAAYATMYKRHLGGEPPASFAVAAIDNG